MRSNERAALARRVLGVASESACEVIVTSTRSGLTRFTQNAIHQNMAGADTTVRVRTIVDGRTGVAETNDLRDAALHETVARASDIAALAPRDQDAVPIACNAPAHAPNGAFAATTADATPADRALVTAAIIAATERESLWAAGFVTTGQHGITIANSAGTLQSFDGTDCGLNIKANGPDATGFAERYDNDFAMLDGAGSASIATRKASLAAGPIAVDPGAWTVILEPAAIGELLSYLTDHFSAQTFDEGSSFLCDGLGRSYAGENVTMEDDFGHPLHAGMPFDYEGYPRHRVSLFSAGIAKNVVTDARWAARLGRPNTGHGLPAPSGRGPEPANLVVAGGEQHLEALVAETQRGLLVSRFWYIRPVDQRKTIVTGMTRDGTFLIEGGRLTRGVRNMRFNQSILEALRHCEFAIDQKRTSGYGYSIVVPAAKIQGFRFTSVTDF